ncbi:hypothetical protein RAS1_18350 [Phycisphaerae bacterium RAS1]|nr:hypothetical protein RAS1_18350 [Phycisphaerae bacterium RAS1]
MPANGATTASTETGALIALIFAGVLAAGLGVLLLRAAFGTARRRDWGDARGDFDGDGGGICAGFGGPSGHDAHGEADGGGAGDGGCGGGDGGGE